MVDETITEFSRFLEHVNPSDFLCASAAEAKVELLASTTNPADMAEALELIQSFLSKGETKENSRRKVLSVALPLARNNNIDSHASAALIQLFTAGLNEVGLMLAQNYGLRTGQYLFLARTGNAEVRIRLAENPCVGPEVLEVLLKDDDELVVLQALDNRECSRAMTFLAEPKIVKAYSRIKALQVTDILRARTAADFAACEAPDFDARLLEAYANNPCSPEDLIKEISAHPTVAGQIATLHLNEMYYKFQK